MDEPDNRHLEIGARIRLSKMGKERLRKMTGDRGVIVGKARYSDAVRIRLDGRSTAITLHKSYLEADN
jgi:hypothetical protein